MQATLSHYRILEQIGAGGMGVVFRAHDENLDRDVAVKILSSLKADVSAHKRFHREALTLSRLNHPNIATVHDFGKDDGSDYLVEEYIEGRSLDIVLTAGPLSEDKVVEFGLQLAQGLAAAHEHGIIHCDLKPSNIRVTPDARLKILDFGLARMLQRESTPNAETETLTDMEFCAGTLPYMAPEQLLGRTVDGRTDIWALGCVLYEMAAGHRSFPSAGPLLTEAILHQTPTPIGKLNPVIGNTLTTVIEKCLEKDPDKRFQSVKEIIVDLRRAASGPTGSATGTRSKRQRSFALVLATVLLAVAGLSTLPLFRKVWREASNRPTAGMQSFAPHELYLAGLKQMERWDKAANLEGAIHSFEQAGNADPSFALAFSGLGEAYWAKYRLDRNPRWIDEAEKNSRRAAELSSNIPAVYVTLARVHRGRGYNNLAVQEIQQALKLEPNDADALLMEAEIFASMGRQQESEAIYKTAVALRPEQWGGYYELGAFYFHEQRYADAAAQFEHVLHLTPDNNLAHATLGGMLLLLDENRKAEDHLKRSLELQPSYTAFTNLGALYYTERRWAEAAIMTKQALQLNAADWVAWSNLGQTYMWLGRRKDADEAFSNELLYLKEAMKVSPENANMHVALGVLYARKKLRQEAVLHLQAALTRSPDDPFVLVSAGEGYENLGDRERAIELVERALEKGWSLSQLENDPGQQSIIRDPRFGKGVKALRSVGNPTR